MSRSKSRGRSPYKTPQSMKKKRKHVSSSKMDTSTTSSIVSSLISSKSFKQAALKSAMRVLGVPPGIPPKTYLGKSMYDKPKVKGYSGSTHLGGKIGRGKKYGKKIKNNGKYTIYGIEKKGITLATEHRTQVTGQEVIAIGHTSLPAKYAAIQMWRALLKYLFVRMGLEVRDTGALMTSFGATVGDTIKFAYYDSNAAVSPVSSNFVVSATDTFDYCAAQFAANFDDVQTGFDDRLESIEYVPVAASGLQRINLKIALLKIALHSKSALKIQNITVENDVDNEDSDVTRVPLQGVQYTCKGNNVLRKANNETLPGLYDSFNEHTLFKAFDKAGGQVIGGTSVEFYPHFAGGNSNETTFTKTSELPKPWEISNCVKSKKFYAEPGAIRTSVVTANIEMTFASFWKLIYLFGSTNNTYLQYNPKQGVTNTIFIEKVVGRPSTAANNIKLWTETEFRMSCVVFGKENAYTLPITYQVNKT